MGGVKRPDWVERCRAIAFTTGERCQFLEEWTYFQEPAEIRLDGVPLCIKHKRLVQRHGWVALEVEPAEVLKGEDDGDNRGCVEAH